MKKIDRKDVLKLILVLTLVAGTGLALGSIGRFTPSHMIVEEVYCGSCHPEQVQELNATTHLVDFKSGIESDIEGGRVPINATATYPADTISAAMATTDACTMCHNYWDNMKWFGVANLDIKAVQTDNPAPIEDIYGNTVSPYGLSSTREYQVNLSYVVPWNAGLDVYHYNRSGTNFTRVDYLWSALSAVSPGPGDALVEGGPYTCGTSEKGMCHVAKRAVELSELGKRPETQAGTGIAGSPYGSGVFFRHEMAYTTAQYAAKPVKLCGACHVFKLPPMTWGGEPWSQGVIEAASANGGVAPMAGNGDNLVSIATGNNNPNDPFGFVPNYDMTGFQSLNYKDHSGTTHYNDITYKTPDWAHQNVPCMRCHVHAGINGETVSSNSETTTNPGTPFGKSAPTHI